MLSTLLLLTALISYVLPAAARIEVTIEHAYFDNTQKFDRVELQRLINAAKTPHRGFFGTVDGTILVPLAIKLKCKGDDCPNTSGRAAAIQQSTLEGVNDVTVYIEETAGWLLLWRNKQRTIPLVPVVASTSGDVYLQHPRTGRLVLY